MRPSRLLTLMGAAAIGLAVGPLVAAQPAETVRRIYVAPPIQWDNAMLSFRLSLNQTPTDFARLTGGIGFGMNAANVNASLAEPLPGLNWASMPLANEFPEEVRYFVVRLAAAGDLAAGIAGCVGANSHVVLLFRGRGLFRISWRLVPDAACPDPIPAATDVMARYVPIARELALSVRYRNAGIEVVDVTEPTAGPLLSTRWQTRAR